MSRPPIFRVVHGVFGERPRFHRPSNILVSRRDEGQGSGLGLGLSLGLAANDSQLAPLGHLIDVAVRGLE